MDYLHAFLGLYPWRIELAGGRPRARYPLAGDTFLELVETEDGAGGGGWQGLTLALDAEHSPGLGASAVLDGLAHPRDPVPAHALGARDTAGVALSFTWGGP